MDFKKHAKIISNILVVLAVIIAAYIKWTDDGSEVFFKENDVYIIGGIVLGMVLINFFKQRGKR